MLFLTRVVSPRVVWLVALASRKCSTMNDVVASYDDGWRGALFFFKWALLLIISPYRLSTWCRYTPCNLRLCLYFKDVCVWVYCFAWLMVAHPGVYYMVWPPGAYYMEGRHVVLVWQHVMQLSQGYLVCLEHCMFSSCSSQPTTRKSAKARCRGTRSYLFVVYDRCL